MAHAVTGGRHEAPVIAKLDPLQPAAPVEVHTHGFGTPSWIGIDEAGADDARCQPFLTRDSIKIGNMQTIPEDARDAEVCLWVSGHAAAMLGPLLGYQ